VAFVEITPRDLQARLERGEQLQLIDVRERFEWDVTRLVIVYCKAGTRGRVAASYLVDAGFQRVANLAGGIARWSQEVDPSLRPY